MLLSTLMVNLARSGTGPAGAGPDEWETRSALALVAHIAESHHDPEQIDIARLRELLERARREAGPDDPGLASIGDLVRDLEKVSARHLDTTAVLFAHVVAIEQGGPTFARPAGPRAALLIQELRTEHERFGALFAAARRIAVARQPSRNASSAVRFLHEGLLRIGAMAREHAHLENDVLVAHVLALDPSIERDVVPSALPIRRREAFSGEGRREEISVFCPTKRGSVAPDWCRGCPLVREVTEQHVRCTPSVEPERPAEKRRRLGESIPVGEAMKGFHVSVGRDVAAGAIASALQQYGVAAAVVVDDAGGVIGTIEKDCALCAAPRETAKALEREGPSVHESSSLADAVACMARTHARFLPVVGTDGRVVGLIADVDALDSITRHGRRRQGASPRIRSVRSK
jgi:iron-sulfur cluster repair protein YtfE (RIC family)